MMHSTEDGDEEDNESSLAWTDDSSEGGDPATLTMALDGRSASFVRRRCAASAILPPPEDLAPAPDLLDDDDWVARVLPGRQGASSPMPSLLRGSLRSGPPSAQSGFRPLPAAGSVASQLQRSQAMTDLRRHRSATMDSAVFESESEDQGLASQSSLTVVGLKDLVSSIQIKDSKMPFSSKGRGRFSVLEEDDPVIAAFKSDIDAPSEVQDADTKTIWISEKIKQYLSKDKQDLYKVMVSKTEHGGTKFVVTAAPGNTPGPKGVDKTTLVAITLAMEHLHKHPEQIMVFHLTSAQMPAMHAAMEHYFANCKDKVNPAHPYKEVQFVVDGRRDPQVYVSHNGRMMQPKAPLPASIVPSVPAAVPSVLDSDEDAESLSDVSLSASALGRGAGAPSSRSSRY